MPYFKGQGGRPKGAKNARTDLHAKCTRVGLDVFERLLELALKAKDQKGEWNKLMSLAKYLYSLPKDEMDLNQFTPEEIRDYLIGLVKEAEAPKSA